MPGVQQNMVVKGDQATLTDKVFMGLPVYTSIFFCKGQPVRYHKRLRNKRLFKKWLKRYGPRLSPRTDADICGSFVLCHPYTLYRFDIKEFIPVEGRMYHEDI